MKKPISESSGVFKISSGLTFLSNIISSYVKDWLIAQLHALIALMYNIFFSSSDFKISISHDTASTTTNNILWK